VIELLEANVEAINNAGDSVPELNAEVGLTVASEAVSTINLTYLPLVSLYKCLILMSWRTTA
jgi:hypothetical protein